jgi:hypothetical protein
VSHDDWFPWATLALWLSLFAACGVSMHDNPGQAGRDYCCCD